MTKSHFKRSQSYTNTINLSLFVYKNDSYTKSGQLSSLAFQLLVILPLCSALGTVVKKACGQHSRHRLIEDEFRVVTLETGKVLWHPGVKDFETAIHRGHPGVAISGCVCAHQVSEKKGFFELINISDMINYHPTHGFSVASIIFELLTGSIRSLLQ